MEIFTIFMAFCKMFVSLSFLFSRIIKIKIQRIGSSFNFQFNWNIFCAFPSGNLSGLFFAGGGVLIEI